MNLWGRGFVYLAALMMGAACSGGGGGSDSSSARRGTGYLKVDLPQISSGSAFVGASSIRPMMAVTTFSIGQPANQLKVLTTNTNSNGECSGVVESIPFFVCMVESLGINQPGSYSGALGPLNLSAQVEELSADPDYNISAEVSDGTSTIFTYRANTAGTKGEITYNILAFSTVLGSYTDPNEDQKIFKVIKWDSSTPSQGVVEVSEEFHSSYQSGMSVTKVLRYMKAFVDEESGIADIVSKYSSKSWLSLVPRAQVDTYYFQNRVVGNTLIEAYVSCSEAQTTESAVALGTQCASFAVNNSARNDSTNYADWRVHDYSTEPQNAYPGNLVGGTWNGETISSVDALVLTAPGTAVLNGSNNWTVPGAGFGTTALDAALAATRAGTAAFSFEIDTTQSGQSGVSVAKLVQDVQSMTWASLDTLVAGQ